MNFTDTKGRKFECKITFATTQRLKPLGCDINAFLHGKQGIESLADDPEVFVPVLYECCREGVTEQKVNLDDFMEGLGGDTLADAFGSFMEAVISFCQPSMRGALRKLWTKGQAFVTAKAAAKEAEIEAMDFETLTSTAAATSKPESSA